MVRLEALENVEMERHVCIQIFSPFRIEDVNMLCLSLFIGKGHRTGKNNVLFCTLVTTNDMLLYPGSCGWSESPVHMVGSIDIVIVIYCRV